MRKTIIIICLYLSICVFLPYPITLLMQDKNNNEDKSGEPVQKSISEMEDYIVSRMAPYYMPGDSGEFLKALAIVIRTGEGLSDEDGLWVPECWSYSMMQENWGEYYPAYYEAIMTAIRDTDGIVMTMETGKVKPYFCRLSAGYTRIMEGSNLAMVGCNEDLSSPEYLSVVTLSGEKILSLIKKEYPTLRVHDNILNSIQIVSRDEAGYITEVMVGNINMSGDDLARVLGLNSGNFIITNSGDGLVFTVKGIGMGYGMSLYSARKKAQTGAGYREILFYYYKNIVIEDV